MFNYISTSKIEKSKKYRYQRSLEKKSEINIVRKSMARCTNSTRENLSLKIHDIRRYERGNIAVTRSNLNGTAYNPTSEAELAREKLF